MCRNYGKEKEKKKKGKKEKEGFSPTGCSCICNAHRKVVQQLSQYGLFSCITQIFCMVTWAGEMQRRWQLHIVSVAPLILCNWICTPLVGLRSVQMCMIHKYNVCHATGVLTQFYNEAALQNQCMYIQGDF